MTATTTDTINETYATLFARIDFERDRCHAIRIASPRLRAEAEGHIDRLDQIEGYLLLRRVRTLTFAGL